jgi:hypothetical protein
VGEQSNNLDSAQDGCTDGFKNSAGLITTLRLGDQNCAAMNSLSSSMNSPGVTTLVPEIGTTFTA